MRNQPGVGSELPYATAAAFRAALKAKSPKSLSTIHASP